MILLSRLIRFRREVVVLWRALWSPVTPLYLKIATVLTAVYLISPIDLIPEFIPLLGFVDDIILVPLVVSWIVSRLPQTAPASSHKDGQSPHAHNGQTIDGTARRR